MSKIVAVEHLTMDGVMQGPGRPDEDRRDSFNDGGWAAARAGDAAIQKTVAARMGSSWSLLVGRITYENFYGFWPKQLPNPMTEALNRVDKFVASTTLTEPLHWQNSKLLTGDVPSAVGELRRTHDKTLVIFGSGVLVQTLMPHDLIDEFVLPIHPIVLGQGRRLFPKGGAPARLELVEATTTATGVVIATWKLVA